MQELHRTSLNSKGGSSSDEDLGGGVRKVFASDFADLIWALVFFTGTGAQNSMGQCGAVDNNASVCRMEKCESVNFL